MDYILFADESGISGSEKCYTIGAIAVPQSHLKSFNQTVASLLQQHGVVGEAKWKKISNGHGLINFGLDVLKRTLRSGYYFNAIVVHKGLYKNWHSDRERAFYQTYTLLARYCADRMKKTLDVRIDNKSDSYDKQHEVVEIVTNHMLKQIESDGKVIGVTKVDSKQAPGLQVADILTGAINAAHHKYLNPKLQMSPGKLLFIERMACILGWDAIVYDTWPNTNFNIWHFPIEYRANPGTKHITPDLDVPFVSPEELISRS